MFKYELGQKVVNKDTRAQGRIGIRVWREDEKEKVIVYWVWLDKDGIMKAFESELVDSGEWLVELDV